MGTGPDDGVEVVTTTDAVRAEIGIGMDMIVRICTAPQPPTTTVEQAAPVLVLDPLTQTGFIVLRVAAAVGSGMTGSTTGRGTPDERTVVAAAAATTALVIVPGVRKRALARRRAATSPHRPS